MPKKCKFKRTPLKPTNGGASFPLKNILTRLLWVIVWKLFASWTPRQAHPWRRFLLRAFGARMGTRSDVRGTAQVWLPSNLILGNHTLVGPDAIIYNQGVIEIGDQSLISQGAYLCSGTHDYESDDFDLVTKKIIIGSHAWICANSIVCPGTIIGDGCILGAGAVGSGTLDEWSIYRGNPASKSKARTWRPKK